MTPTFDLPAYEVYTINAGQTLAFVPCRMAASEVKAIDKLVRKLGEGSRVKIRREEGDALLEAWKKYRSGEK
jgi:hypothetical protein